MATIKRVETGGATRIIVKSDGGEVKVSCSCCLSIPEFCCPYPASQLGVTYDRQDLPAEITVVVDGVNYVETTLTESGSTFYAGSDTRIVLAVQTWIAQEVDGPGWAAFQNYSPQDCLIFNDNQNEEQAIQWPPPATDQTYLTDKFSDIYIATCTRTINGATTTTIKTYYREELCVWRSRTEENEEDGALYYRSDADEGQAIEFGKGRILWALSGAGFRSENDGPYNSPAGHYGPNKECVVVEP